MGAAIDEVTDLGLRSLIAFTGKLYGVPCPRDHDRFIGGAARLAHNPGPLDVPLHGTDDCTSCTDVRRLGRPHGMAIGSPVLMGQIVEFALVRLATTNSRDVVLEGGRLFSRKEGSLPPDYHSTAREYSGVLPSSLTAQHFFTSQCPHV
jgi:hypothetical protein